MAAKGGRAGSGQTDRALGEKIEPAPGRARLLIIFDIYTVQCFFDRYSSSIHCFFAEPLPHKSKKVSPEPRPTVAEETSVQALLFHNGIHSIGGFFDRGADVFSL
jgi:hypothetical protein